LKIEKLGVELKCLFDKTVISLTPHLTAPSTIRGELWQNKGRIYLRIFKNFEGSIENSTIYNRVILVAALFN
jgi:hypothetical protein